MVPVLAVTDFALCFRYIFCAFSTHIRLLELWNTLQVCQRYLILIARRKCLKEISTCPLLKSALVDNVVSAVRSSTRAAAAVAPSSWNNSFTVSQDHREVSSLLLSVVEVADSLGDNEVSNVIDDTEVGHASEVGRVSELASFHIGCVGNVRKFLCSAAGSTNGVERDDVHVHVSLGDVTTENIEGILGGREVVSVFRDSGTDFSDGIMVGEDSVTLFQGDGDGFFRGLYNLSEHSGHGGGLCGSGDVDDAFGTTPVGEDVGAGDLESLCPSEEGIIRGIYSMLVGSNNDVELGAVNFYASFVATVGQGELEGRHRIVGGSALLDTFEDSHEGIIGGTCGGLENVMEFAGGGECHADGILDGDKSRGDAGSEGIRHWPV